MAGAHPVPAARGEADAHSLTVHLAGTFTPTAEMRWDADRDTDRANDLVTEPVGRAHDSGRLRADAVAHDIGLPLEGCARYRFRTRTGPASHHQR